jgi:hypothetical protein
MPPRQPVAVLAICLSICAQTSYAQAPGQPSPTTGRTREVALLLKALRFSTQVREWQSEDQ